MTVTRTFTDGADRFGVRTADTYNLSFLGGDDVLITQAGITTAHMGDGNDYVRVDGGTTTLFGDSGADRFDLYASGSTADGGSGDDRFNFLGDGTGDTLHGGDGNDLFVDYGRSIGGSIYGDAGNDRFYGFSGQNVELHGGAGNDVYRVNSDSVLPTIIENPDEGTDTVQLLGGPGLLRLPDNVENLKVLGLSGNATDLHRIRANGLDNVVSGSSANEHIDGLGGNDRLYGGGGDDTISGGDGNDSLFGGAGNDVIYGDFGNDRITGGAGFDTMHGGDGADRFIYTAANDAPPGFNGIFDWIVDWQSVDRIDLSAIDANPNIAGNQAFTIDSVFGTPAGPQDPGTVILAGFGGELYVDVYINGGANPDMVISLWSVEGEAALTPANIIA